MEHPSDQENTTSHGSQERSTRRASSRQQDDRRSVTLPQHPAAGRNSTYTSAYTAAAASNPSGPGEQSTSRYQGPSYPTSPSAAAAAAAGPQSFTEPTMSRHASTGPASVPTSRAQQYQLVSPGTPADPRAMSQVSPGFIFVIFSMFAICSFLCPFPGFSDSCACCSPPVSPFSYCLHFICYLLVFCFGYLDVLMPYSSSAQPPRHGIRTRKG